MSWNPVLDFVTNVKNDFMNIYNDYIAVCGLSKKNDDIYDYQSASLSSYKYKNVIDYWVDIIDNDEYKKIISVLQINQNGDLVLLRYGNYSDIFSGEEDITNEEFWNLYNGFYRDCRTVVIDVKRLKVVLCGFKKFFNINELPETNEDNIRNMINNAKNIEVTDKIDGSMQLATYYGGNIVMCGSQSINPNDSWRLQDGLRMLNLDNNSRLREFIVSHPNFCFIFEYVSIKDAHVVVYSKEQEGLYLIGIRNKSNGYQYPYHYVVDIANKLGIKTTKIFDKTFDEVMDDRDKYKSNEKEGYVLNIDNTLVKIKMDDYVLLHHTLSKLASVNATIKSIADGTIDDFISKVPNAYKERINRIAKYVYRYIKETDDIVNKYYDESPKDSRKNFMIYVDTHIPNEYKSYVKNKYLGNNNYYYIKSHNGHYKTLKEMGYKDNYSKLFIDEGE